MDKAPVYHQEIFSKIMQFYTEQSKLSTIRTVFDDVMGIPPKIIAEIWDNWELFDFASLNIQKIFMNLESTIANKGPADTIVCFAGISIYAVINAGEYQEMLEECQKNTFQVILDFGQKVIILFDHNQCPIDDLLKTAAKNPKYKIKTCDGKNNLIIKRKIAKNEDKNCEIFGDLAEILSQCSGIRDVLQRLAPKESRASDELADILANDEMITRINNCFGDYTNIPLKILFQIHQNWNLFKVGTLTCSRLFLDLDQAILAKNPDDTLFYFGNIDIYAVMNSDEYSRFGSFSIKNDIYQIILLSEKQKIILLHSQDSEFIKKLIEVTKKTTKYELQVREGVNQLEIKNKIASNYGESREIYNDLTNTLYKKYKDIGQILRLIEPEINGYSNRILKLLLSGHNLGRMEGLGTTIVINNTKISGTNNGIIHTGSGDNNIGQKNYAVENWIRNNPPQDVSKDKYYELFRNVFGDTISKNKLSSIMIKSGYATNSSRRPRTWKLNK